MSSNSGTSTQHISLPKGGGALQGIGEKFSPDLHTGTGNFSVPIALPSGRNGFQPQLSLAYSTGNGNGPFGLGWGLSIPGVARKTSHGVPRYDDAIDTFILSGSEDLVPISRQPDSPTRYRPRTEGLFARIDHYHGGASDFWEVASRDGLVSRYGTRRPADAPGDWRDPAVVANPEQKRRSQVFAWKLTQTTDPFGNRIEYSYARDLSQVEGPHQWDQVYLSEIRYIDYGDPDRPQFVAHVRLEYEPRPDPFSDYRAGFEIRTKLRCTAIRVSIQPTAEAGVEILARTYRLVYLDQRDLPVEQMPRNGVSLLSEVRVEGKDGDRTEPLPPLEFTYTAFEPEKRRFHSFTGPNNSLPEESLGNPDYALVDLFRDGLLDVVKMNGSVRFWRNRGEGQFDRPRTMSEAPASPHLGEMGVQFFDANGDGSTDLLITDGTRGGYYPLSSRGGWDRRSFVAYQKVPSFTLEDPDVKLLDLDGDGAHDAVRTGVDFELFYNDRDTGWTTTEVRSRKSGTDFPDVIFSDPGVKLADMTGDGRKDIVLIRNGRIDYWPLVGRGQWGARVTMERSPRFGESSFAGNLGYDPGRAFVEDIDGDGLADLVYVQSGRVTIWLNQSGNRWSEPVIVRGTPVTDADTLVPADMLGTGTSGILWSAVGTHRGENYKFLDLTGGVKPYLLSEMNNHLGAVTRVEYAPSTRFYLEDERRPETRWRTSLPFPVHVVSKVEVVDALSKSKLTTEYRYHHGYWDGHEREFRGFGLVEQLDTERFEDFNASGPEGAAPSFARVGEAAFSPPTLTRSWFHQGPISNGSEGWSEPDLAGEWWAGDPPALPRTAETSAVLASLPPAARRDALRAMRGQLLRTELYALDGDERQDRPYLVTERRYGLREEAPPDQGSDRRHVFFPHLLAERTTEWERGNEPMTRVDFTGAYDAYGQPTIKTSLAVPRGRDYRVATSPGEPYLVTQTETVFAQRDDARRYIVDRVARSTTFEIINGGARSLLDTHTAIRQGEFSRPVIGQTFNFYDGPAFQGLPIGQLGDFGALVRTESLVLTPTILTEAAQGTYPPPYFAAGAAPVWTAAYPIAFRTALPANAGYIYQPGGANSPYTQGYFAVTERRRYDFHDTQPTQVRGMIRATRDPLDRETTVAYDPFDLLPVLVTDPVGLTTAATYNYRVLQPNEVTDVNGNRTRVAYTPLGLPATTAVMGKTTQEAGDTDAAPGATFVYDFLAFDQRKKPVSVRATRRIHHVTDRTAPEAERDETIITVEYSDGFGRVLQTRTQTEDIVFGDTALGDAGLPLTQAAGAGQAAGRSSDTTAGTRVVVSGWQVYDNKGRVVEKYEPFFANGFTYSVPDVSELQRLQKTTTFYDPRGQVIRTMNPNGSEVRQIRGVPGTIAAPDLATPEQYEPSPWHLYTYDTNDNAGRTHPGEAIAYRHHWNTPASAVVDPLGRTIETVERNGPNPASDWFVTRSTYDIRGNLLEIRDALNRAALQMTYDLTNRPLRTLHIDAGTQRVVFDAAGREIEGRDAKGALVLRAFDALGRPSRMWARDRAAGLVTLRERIDYGDEANPNQEPQAREVARQANLLGRPQRHYDEAGLLAFDGYDFKGNLLEKARLVIKDDPILAVFAAASRNAWRVTAFKVDWTPPANTTFDTHAQSLLDPTRYETSATYDALNRVTTTRYPLDAAGQRKVLRPRYNRGGALARVELDGAPYVDRIDYNARGQRLLVVYGNGLMTRHAYDPRSGRLARLRSESFTSPAPLTYRPEGAALQDYAYEYDLAGNLIRLLDRTPQSGVATAPDRLDRDFAYDPLYRLLSATGRECDLPPAARPWVDAPRCADITRARAYTETYRYDPLGNLTRLQHQAPGGGFTRDFTLNPGSNRLATLKVGTDVWAFVHDASGNLLQEGVPRFYEWDQGDRMRVFRTQMRAPNSRPEDNLWSEPSVHTHYLYDAGGQRVKKLVRKQGGAIEVTTYVEGFEVRRSGRGAQAVSNTVIHIVDGANRIAQVRTGPAFPDDRRPSLTYELGDHLGSSNVVLDESGRLVDREEHTPYGETSFGSFARKRYRFTGKERDEESGLYYHGARYYAPWLGRWTSCDPLGVDDGLNLYVYAHCDPCMRVDPSGTSDQPPQLHLTQQTELRQPVTATATTPGFGQELRRTYQNLWGQWGPGEVDVGHPEDMPFAKTPAGTTTKVYAQPRGENRSLGSTQDKARIAEARKNGEFVREKGVDLTAQKGMRYGQPELLDKLKGVRAPSPQPPRQLELPLGERKSSSKAPEQLSFDFSPRATPRPGPAMRVGAVAGSITKTAVPLVIEAEIALTGAAYLAFVAGKTALVTPLMTVAEAVPAAGAALVAGAVVGNLAEAGATKLGASEGVAQGSGAVAAMLAGAGVGALIGAPTGIGAPIGAVIGGVAGLGGYYLSKW